MAKCERPENLSICPHKDSDECTAIIQCPHKKLYPYTCACGWEGYEPKCCECGAISEVRKCGFWKNDRCTVASEACSGVGGCGLYNVY